MRNDYKRAQALLEQAQDIISKSGDAPEHVDNFDGRLDDVIEQVQLRVRSLSRVINNYK